MYQHPDPARAAGTEPFRSCRRQRRSPRVGGRRPARTRGRGHSEAVLDTFHLLLYELDLVLEQADVFLVRGVPHRVLEVALEESQVLHESCEPGRRTSRRTEIGPQGTFHIRDPDPAIPQAPDELLEGSGASLDARQVLAVDLEAVGDEVLLDSAGPPVHGEVPHRARSLPV